MYVYIYIYIYIFNSNPKMPTLHIKFLLYLNTLLHGVRNFYQSYLQLNEDFRTSI